MDPQIDARLRDVPLPRGFMARLKSSVIPADDQLDARLREVKLPHDLLNQLLEIPGDERVDGELCEIAVPFEVVSQARRISWRARMRKWGERAADLATAAILFLGASLALTSLAAALAASIYPHAAAIDKPVFVVATNSPLALESSSAPPSVQFSEAAPLLQEESRPVFVSTSSRTIFDLDSPDVSPYPLSGPVSGWFAALNRGARPLDNVVLARWGILGYPQFGEEAAPALESPKFPRAAGVEFPLVRGYDRAFAIRHGVFPPVAPSAHRALERVELPLVTDTASHFEVQQLLEQGRIPPPSLVRTEEFLAAMGCRFPPAAPGELAIRTAAGPSAFGPKGTGLLQIAAIAGELPGRTSAGKHLVLAIDDSASMRRGNRLKLVQRAVDRLLTHLGPRDRLSIVVFHEEVEYEVERASMADGDEIRRVFDKLRPSHGTDLAEGLQRALALAWRHGAEDGDAARIVLVTDSHVSMPSAAQTKISDMLGAASAGGVQMDVLDVGDQPQRDEVLAGWAELTHGGVRRPQSLDEAAWLLVESLYGRSPVVARDVRMTVQFNPQAVAAYRLIGHEANAMTTVRPASHSAELRAGEGAATLLEIWFQSGEDDEVGQVELVWRDPQSGREQRRTQRISRIQFAPTWEQSPLSLQQAAIAAQTAEILRGSRIALRELGLVAPGKGNLDELLETAKNVPAQLGEQREFRKWKEFLDLLVRIRGP